RVRWAGAVPAAPSNSGIDLAIRQPQLDADWARTQIAGVKTALADQRETELVRVATDTSRSIADRRRALDLMVYFGPRPSAQLLISLTRDFPAEIRCKDARLMF